MTQGEDNSTDLGYYILGMRESVLRDVAENASGSSVASLRADIVSREWGKFLRSERNSLEISGPTPELASERQGWV